MRCNVLVDFVIFSLFNLMKCQSQAGCLWKWKLLVCSIRI